MSASVQVYRLHVIPASGTPDLPPSVEALFHQPFTQKELLYMLAAAGRLPRNYAAAMTSSAAQPDAAQADIGDKAPSAALCCKGLPSPVPFDRILYATSDGHYTLITCGPPARTIRVRASFSGILEKLSDTRFLSCARGVLLNMDHVKTKTPDAFCMDDGAVFAIRRSGRRLITARYKAYKGTGRTAVTRRGSTRLPAPPTADRTSLSSRMRSCPEHPAPP